MFDHKQRFPKCCTHFLSRQNSTRKPTVPLSVHTIELTRVFTWCVFVRASLHMRREEKLTRCHWMVYCTYNTLNMFRALLLPIIRRSKLYVCYYSLRCAVLGCWLSGGQVQDSRFCVQEEGCWTTCNIPLPGRIDCRSAPDPRQPATRHFTP